MRASAQERRRAGRSSKLSGGACGERPARRLESIISGRFLSLHLGCWCASECERVRARTQTQAQTQAQAQAQTRAQTRAQTQVSFYYDSFFPVRAIEAGGKVPHKKRSTHFYAPVRVLQLCVCAVNWACCSAAGSPLAGPRSVRAAAPIGTWPLPFSSTRSRCSFERRPPNLKSTRETALIGRRRAR